MPDPDHGAEQRDGGGAPRSSLPSFRARMLVVGLVALVAVGACLRPSEDRVDADRDVGLATEDLIRVEVSDHLAAIQTVDEVASRMTLWAQAPSLEIELESLASAPRTWRIELLNVVADIELSARTTAGDDVSVSTIASGTTTGGADVSLPTVAAFELELQPGATVVLDASPPDADAQTPWRFGVLSDVQDALPEFDDIVVEMNAQDDMRFVISTGDLTEQGTAAQLRNFQRALRDLDVPLYSTTGNHENGVDAEVWAGRFGAANFSWVHRGVRFTLVDSGHATIDPRVYDQLDGWLAASEDMVHVFATHIAPIDPVGTRNGSFRSRKEAGKLLYELAKGDVDVTFYGHIHSYYAFENAGIPAYISGGGGAIEERLDGIGRHFLLVDVDPVEQRHSVGIVRVD